MILQAANHNPATHCASHRGRASLSTTGSSNDKVEVSEGTQDRSSFDWKKIAKHSAIGAGVGAATSTSGLLGEAGVCAAAIGTGAAGAVYGFSTAASQVLPEHAGLVETFVLGPLALMLGTGGAVVGAGGGGLIGAASAFVGGHTGAVGIAATTLLGAAIGGTSEYMHQKQRAATSA